MSDKKSIDRLSGICVICALFAASIVCGSIGWQEYIGGEMSLTWTDIAYRLLMLFTVNASFDEPNVPLLLDIARFLSPLTLAGTVIFVTLSFFKARLTAFMVRTFYRKHAVFYGCGARSLVIASDIVKARRVVFLLEERDESVLDGIAEIGAVALSGSSSVQSAFRQAALHRASWFFVMPTSDIASQSISHAAEDFLMARHGTKRPSIFVEYTDDFSLRIAREQSEARSAKKSASSDYISMHPFNLELQLAREVVDGCQPDFASMHEPFHTAVFGFDKLGQMLAFEAAQMFHFPDLKPPRVTIIDRDIEAKWKDFLLRHPGFDRIANVRIVEASDWSCAPDAETPSLALISFSDSALAFDTGRILRQRSLAISPSAPERRAVMTKIVIIPSVDSAEQYPALEYCRDFLEINGIDIIATDAVLNGMDIINRAESCDALAKGIHYSWMAKPGEVWDTAIVDGEWAKLSDTLRDSNRYAARHLFVKLKFLGWNTASAKDRRVSPDSSPQFDFSALDEYQLERLSRLEHNRWIAEKYLAGYLPTMCVDPDTYRIHKNNNHLHGNLVPWENLSRDDQLKDTNALLFAPEIAKTAGLRLVLFNSR